MAEWILIPSLKQLRDEFNIIAPNRDKASDGSVGDAAHQTAVSDHNPDETGNVPIEDADKVNEVHAIDVDKDLKQPNLTMEKVVQFLLERCRSGQERRLRYIIYNRRIWSASSDWVQKAYTGASPHTEHAHFSASYDTAREASTASWHLEDLMAGNLTDEDKEWFKAYTSAFWARTAQPDNGGVTSKVGRDALDQGIPNGIQGKKTPAWQTLEDISREVALIKGILISTEGVDDTDESTIVAGILAGLSDGVLANAFRDAGFTPEALAALIPDSVAEQVVALLVARVQS